MLGRELFGSGLVVRIVGVARPLVLGVLTAIGMLGARVCRAYLEAYRPGRGVAAGSILIDFLRAAGIGVCGRGLTVTDASDSGGDGGVMFGRCAFDLCWGGVEAAVGDE